MMSAPSRHDPNPNAAMEQGPLSPLGVKLLKIAIVVMGIMIVVGVAVAIGRVIYLASAGSSETDRSVSGNTSLAPHHTLPLPDGARVSQASLQGDRLLVRYEVNGRTELAIYDLRRSRLVSTIVVRVGGSPAAIPTNPAGGQQ
jgi:hypothetical protein